MQLFPGGGGGSDLGKALTLAAIGAGAYYGLGGLTGHGVVAVSPSSQTAWMKLSARGQPPRLISPLAVPHRE